MDNDLNFDEFLFVTEVGSRMWHHEELSSDHDLFCVYQTPARDYMRTGNFKPTRAARPHVMIDNAEYDFQYMEIGHLVGLLCKGNVNAIWAVCSPIVHKPSPVLGRLKQITINNLSKASYDSIKGMASSQFLDAERRKAVRNPLKSYMTCARTLEFGHSMLLGGGLDFFSVKREVGEEECNLKFEQLDKAYAISKLPESVNATPFKDFLFNIRMEDAVGNIDLIMKYGNETRHLY